MTALGLAQAFLLLCYFGREIHIGLSREQDLTPRPSPVSHENITPRGAHRG